MPPTEEDVLMIGTQVDLAGIQVGMEQASSVVAAKTQQMTLNFEGTAAATKVLDTSIAKLGAGGTGGNIDTLNAQLKAMQATIEQLQAQVVALEAKLATAPKRGISEFTEARHTIMGTGEMIGVHLPRHITSFIAHLDGVGPALAKAFSVVAIIGILEILPRIGAAIEEMAEKLGGWDAQAKKTYDHLIEYNQKLYLESLKQKEEQRAAAEAGLTGHAKLAAQAKDTAANAAELAAELSKLQQRATQTTEAFAATHHGLAALVRTSKESKDLADEYSKSMERQRTVIEEVETRLRKYHTELAIKIPAEEQAERNTQAIALGKARLEAEKTISEASVAFQIQSAKEMHAVGELSEAELIAVLRNAEDTKYEIEKQAIVKRRALALQEQATMGKEAAPELTAAEAAREKLEVEHQARLSAINAAGAASLLAQDNAVVLARLKGAKAVADAEVGLADSTAKEQLAHRQISISEETSVLLAGEQKRFEAAKKVREEDIIILKQNTEKNKAAIIMAEAELEADEKIHQGKLETIRAEGATKEIENQRRLMQEQVHATEQSANQQLSMAREMNNTRLRLHQETLSQWGAAERVAIEKWYNEQRTVLLQQLQQAKTIFGQESVEYKKMLDTMTHLDQQHRMEVQKIDDQMALRMKQMLDKMSNDFNNAFAQWATGHQTFAKAFMTLEDQMAQNFVKNLLKMMEQMLVAALMHKAVAKQGILVDAKSAAAGAYNAIVGIPYVGPVLAPIAAATAFTAVMAFGSFDRGGVVPQDMMGQVHKNEMVLDPHISMGLQNLIRSGHTGAGHTINMGGVEINNHPGGSGTHTEAELVRAMHRAARKGLLAA